MGNSSLKGKNKMDHITVGVVATSTSSSEKSSQYIELLEANNIKYIKIDLKLISMDKALNKVLQCSHVIFIFAHYDTDRQIVSGFFNAIELKGIKVFPNYSTAWHYDDKIAEYSLLKLFNKESIFTNAYFTKVALEKEIDNMNFPIVFKLKKGASSNTVKLINSKESLLNISKRMFTVGFSPIDSFILFEKEKIKNIIRIIFYKTFSKWPTILRNNWNKEKGYVLLQEFMPNNDYDTRITVIGNKAFAFRRFNREGDFRASGSGKISYNQDGIDKKMIQMAFECSKELNFQSMAYDFLYDKNRNPKICEISYTYQSEAIFNCPGYWTDDLKFESGNYWPEQFHIEELLNMKLNIRQTK